MTAESDDQDAGIAVPGDESAQDATDGGTPVLDLDTLDDLTDDEAAEVLGLSAGAVRERLATAGTRYLGKLSRTHPDIALSDIEGTIRSIRPGVHRRFGSPEA